MAIRLYEQGDELRDRAAKELAAIERIRREIARKQEMLLELEARKTSVRIPSTQSEAVKSSPSGEAAYVRIMELCDLRREEIDSINLELTEQLIEIERRIDALDDATERDVLFYRYVKGLEWDDVARRTHYCSEWCRGKLHKRALLHYGMRFCA